MGDLVATFPAAAVGLAAPGLDAVVGLAVLDAAVPVPGTLLAAVAAVLEPAAAVDVVVVLGAGLAVVVAERVEEVAAAAAVLARADDELLAEDVGLLPGEVAGLAVLAPAAVPFERGFRAAAAAVGLAAVAALVVAAAAVDLAVVDDEGLDDVAAAGAVRVAGGFEEAVEPAGLVEAVGLGVGVTRDTVGLGAPLAVAAVALPGREVPDAGLQGISITLLIVPKVARKFRM